jgi:Rrf2 family protein
MKLSVKSEYACLALIALSENHGEKHLRISDIAEMKGLPKKYLEQILLSLKNAGYVKSKMGAEGGYKLAKPASSITLAEVIRLMDGALAPVLSVSKYFYESTPIEKSKKLIEIFADIREYTAKKLEQITFEDLV